MGFEGAAGPIFCVYSRGFASNGELPHYRDVMIIIEGWVTDFLLCV